MSPAYLLRTHPSFYLFYQFFMPSVYSSSVYSIIFFSSHLFTMNLDALYPDLLERRTSGQTVDELLSFIRQQGVSTSKRTLERRLQRWGINKPKLASIHDLPDLKELIIELFCFAAMTDSEMLHVLNQKYSQDLTRDQLVTFRMELGLRRRTANINIADTFAREAITTALSTGPVDGFGKGLLYSYFRKGGIPIARDRIQRLLREINPEAVARRRTVRTSRNGNFFC
jgi:hypothetical protein